jgi:hypothetical protein
MKRWFALLAITAAAPFAQGGAASADNLMKQVFAALAQKDSAAL